ncbi:MAG TPA: DUF4097 family beta strand repeat-containing protein [Thermoanaerobaculia bacterium]|nr:DUF4097 family beta strand repeat-containing protein [Thermoanaerobaculia bacterium]
MRRHLAATLALATVLFIAGAAMAAEDTIKKGFNVADGGTLRLDSAYGDVRIVTGGDGVAVEVIRKADGRRGEERMREHKIEFRQDGNDVIVEGDRDGDNHGWSNWIRWSDEDYEVQWNVRIPKTYNVEVKTSGGSIETDDIGGTLDARTSGGGIKTGRLLGNATLKTSGGGIRIGGGNGDILAHTSGGSVEIGDTTGEVEAKTSGGSISLARVGGKVLARTSGGGIRIDDAMGSVDASTSGGSITARLSRQPAGDSKLSTSGGSVSVSVASGLNFELDARASGGGVRSDIPLLVQGLKDDDSLQGRIGNGGPKLVLRTSGGGIRVKPL